MFPLLLRHTSRLSVLFLGFAAGAEAANEYRLDDGVKELGIGLQPSRQYSLAWLNRFVIRSGYETITAVNVAFGGSLLASNIPNGTPVAVHVWLDSNLDGLPDHDPVLATATGFVANSGTNTFNSYALLQPLTFQAGDIIFAGAIVAYTGMPQVAAIDTDGTDEPPTYPPNDHSFIAANWATPPAPLTPIDPNHLAWADLPVATVRAALFGGTSDGNWMIRLDATGTAGTPLPVVSPTTLDLGSVDPGAAPAASSACSMRAPPPGTSSCTRRRPVRCRRPSRYWTEPAARCRTSSRQARAATSTWYSHPWATAATRSWWK